MDKIGYFLYEFPIQPPPSVLYFQLAPEFWECERYGFRFCGDGDRVHVDSRNF